MGRFKGRNYSFHSREVEKRIDCLFVSHGHIGHSLLIPKETVFWTYSRVVEPARYAVRFKDLPEGILHQVRVTPMESSRSPTTERGTVSAGESLTPRFSSIEHDRLFEKGMKHS